MMEMRTCGRVDSYELLVSHPAAGIRLLDGRRDFIAEGEATLAVQNNVFDFRSR